MSKMKYTESQIGCLFEKLITFSRLDYPKAAHYERVVEAVISTATMNTPGDTEQNIFPDGVIPMHGFTRNFSSTKTMKLLMI